MCVKNLKTQRPPAQTLLPFLDRLGKSDRIVILHDWDADGVSAGVVLDLALQKMGFVNIACVKPDRERNAWTPANRERVKRLAPQALFVLDLGVGKESVVPGVPTCFIDHHRPEGSLENMPEGSLILSDYGSRPTRNTSLMVWDFCSKLTDISELDWIAVLGTLSDLGDRAPFELVDATRARHKTKHLKDVTSLINSVRRSAHPDPETASRALLKFKSPKELLDSDDPDVRSMKKARDEVKRAFTEAKRYAPRISGQTALIEVHSPCQIHPMIARLWCMRLPKHYIIAANTGYSPGRVNFSARSTGGLKVLQLLRSIELPASEGNYGQGHDRASGGSLPFDHWELLLEKLGFAPERS